MTDLDFNPDELRQRYRDERDKRLRSEANEQYTEMTGQFAHYLEDPYIAFEERAPITKEVQVAIVGGGFGGMLVGARQTLLTRPSPLVVPAFARPQR
jgi:cyclohexanone monooxygenase